MKYLKILGMGLILGALLVLYLNILPLLALNNELGVHGFFGLLSAFLIWIGSNGMVSAIAMIALVAGAYILLRTGIR